MNVNMDEFIVVSRASHILFSQAVDGKTVSSIYPDMEPSALKDLEHLICLNKDRDSFFDTGSRLDIIRNLRFLLEGAIPGLSFSSFILSRVDHTMENVFMINFPHTRKDNGEVVDVKLAIVVTESDVLLISPFNCPSLGTINEGNQYIISILNTSYLNRPNSNKASILDILDKPLNEDTTETYGNKLMHIIDLMATDIHMQCEFFLKAHSHIQDQEYKVVTKDSKEFEHIYRKYDDSINYSVDDDIAITDFMPIIISEDEVNKTLCAEHRYNGVVGRVESRIIGCESYDELNMAPSGSIREVLIRCPEENVPAAIKLPFNVIYVGYNTIVTENDPTCYYKLLDTDAPILPEQYVPGINIVPGTEAINTAGAKELFTTLKQFGISKTSKFYEFFYPILKMPADVIKSALITARSVFSASAKIEAAESERLKEKMLNDELDVTMDKVDNMFKSYILMATIITVLGGYYIGLIVWLFARGRVKKGKIKAYERVERRLVSKIREYETKINFANQESDYKSVKALTHTMDTYKMMLDKLREVKRESLGKEEKYTDTYSEYQD